MRLNPRKLYAIVVLAWLVLAFISNFVHTPTVQATTIFSDGFESGDLTMWTGSAAATATIAAVATPTHHGSYAANVTGITAENSYAAIYKDITAASDVYERCYVLVDSAPTENNRWLWIGPYLKNQASSIVLGRSLFGKNAEGTLQVGLYFSASPSIAYANFAWNIDTWYMVEVRAKKGALDSFVELWIDGTLKINATGLAANYDITRIYAGAGWFSVQGTGWATTVSIDCATVADSYVGADSPTASSMATSTTTAGASCMFSALFTPPSGANLSHYVFSTNNTGSWINDTAVAFSGSGALWANATKTLSVTIGNRVEWITYANDTAGAWGSTGPQYLVTTSAESPYFYWNSVWVNSTQRNQPALFSVKWNAGSGTLSHYVFECNNSGTLANTTDAFSGSPTVDWSNVTTTLNVAYTAIVWRMYANNSYGIFAATMQFTLHNITVQPWETTLGNVIYRNGSAFTPYGYFLIWGADTDTQCFEKQGESEGAGYTYWREGATRENLQAMALSGANIISTYYCWENWIRDNNVTLSDYEALQYTNASGRKAINDFVLLAEDYDITLSVRPYCIVQGGTKKSSWTGNSTDGFTVSGLLHTGYQATTSVTFSASWLTTSGTLGTAEFYWNASGTMALNGTVALSGTSSQGNFTRVLPTLAGENVTWYMRANRTDGTWLYTPMQWFRITEPARPEMPYAPYHKGVVVSSRYDFIDKYLEMAVNLSAHPNVWFHPFDEPTQELALWFETISNLTMQMRGAGIHHIFQLQYSYCGSLYYVDNWMGNTTNLAHTRNIVVAPHLYRMHGSFGTAYGLDPQAEWTYDGLLNRLQSDSYLRYDHVLNGLNMPIMVGAIGACDYGNVYGNWTQHQYEYTAFNNTLEALDYMGIGYCVYQWQRTGSVFRTCSGGTAIRLPNDIGIYAVAHFHTHPFILSVGTSTYIYGNNTAWSASWNSTGSTLNITYTGACDVRIYWNISNSQYPINASLTALHQNGTLLVASNLYEASTNLIRLYSTSSGYWVIGYNLSGGEEPTDNPPSYGSTSASTTVAGQTANFTCVWFDDYGLSYGILSSNLTGAWQNKTKKAMAAVPMPQIFWDTLTLPSQVGTILAYSFYANDTAGQWTATITYYLTVTGSATVEGATYYLRGDTRTTNTITGYRLDQTQSAIFTYASMISAGSHTAYYGFRIYLIGRNGGATELSPSEPAAVITRVSDGYGYFTAEWTCPEKYLTIGVTAIELDLYMKFDADGTWQKKATFITEVLVKKKLSSTTWTFTVWTQRGYVAGNTYAYAYWGDATINTKVANVLFTEPSQLDMHMLELQNQDFIGFIAFPYTQTIGNLFYALIMLGICGSVYLRGRSIIPLLILFTIFGGAAGIFNILIGEVAWGIAWFLLLLGLAGLLYKVFR